MMTRDLVVQTIANVLGADETDITPHAEFQLDLNATTDELIKIKKELERMLDIQLDEFDPESAETVQDLFEQVEDALL